MSEHITSPRQMLEKNIKPKILEYVQQKISCSRSTHFDSPLQSVRSYNFIVDVELGFEKRL